MAVSSMIDEDRLSSLCPILMQICQSTSQFIGESIGATAENRALLSAETEYLMRDRIRRLIMTTIGKLSSIRRC